LILTKSLLVDVAKSPRPSIWHGELEIIIRNQIDDMELRHGICHVSRGERIGDFSAVIMPRSKASTRFRALMSSAGCIECCLVYELIDQRNERVPIMANHQVFVAVRGLIVPLTSRCKASTAMFMARRGQFTGSENDIRRLKNRILRGHLVNNTYSFKCAIVGRTLRLEAVFQSGRKSILDTMLDETIGHINNCPVLFEGETSEL
jgi:hypothetical protein